MQKFIFVALLAVIVTVIHVKGHGRLMEPPMRSSIWRVPEFAGLNPPKNYNDNELFCGGAGVQHGQNGGKCGECGDPWHVAKPRPNEGGGGEFAKGIIVRNYHKGQTVDVDVDLTTSHKGYFEFRLCPWNQPNVPEQQSCFDQHLLHFADGSNKFYINGNSGHYYPKVVLPNDINCSQCILQWKYTAGNTWGDCGNGTSASGCGPQETFVNCADISIN